MSAIRKLAGFISKFIPSGTILPILKGPLRGSKYVVGAAAGEGKGLSIVFNLSETERLEMAKTLLTPETVCFDVGANIGHYTLLFAKHAKYVFAFEPLPRNIRYLHKMLEANSVNNATIVPCAVSNSTKIVSFQEGENCAVGKIDEQGKQPVMTISIDEFSAKYQAKPSLLKIDVEGEEMAVLNGAKNLIHQHRPVVLLETHDPDTKKDCLEFFKQLGYSKVVLISENNEACDFAIIP